MRPGIVLGGYILRAFIFNAYGCLRRELERIREKTSEHMFKSTTNDALLDYYYHCDIIAICVQDTTKLSSLLSMEFSFPEREKRIQ